MALYVGSAGPYFTSLPRLDEMGPPDLPSLLPPPPTARGHREQSRSERDELPARPLTPRGGKKQGKKECQPGLSPVPSHCERPPASPLLLPALLVSAPNVIFWDWGGGWL